MSQGKRFKGNSSMFDSNKEYHLVEAVDLLHSFIGSKFDESINISFNFF